MSALALWVERIRFLEGGPEGVTSEDSAGQGVKNSGSPDVDALKSILASSCRTYAAAKPGFPACRSSRPFILDAEDADSEVSRHPEGGRVRYSRGGGVMEWISRWKRGLAALLVASGGALLAASCGESGPKTYEVEEVSFEYPGGWREGDVDDALASNQEWVGLVGIAPDDDDDDVENYIYVSKYRLNIEIDEDLIADELDSLDGEIRGILESDGGEITDGPDVDDIKGFPALRYEGTTEERRNEFGHLWIFIFDGRDEYFFNCQWDEDHEDEVEDACEVALDTFELD
jgi:hypothetical protein